jgi:hypothetical protein
MSCDSIRVRLILWLINLVHVTFLLYFVVHATLHAQLPSPMIQAFNKDLKAEPRESERNRERNAYIIEKSILNQQVKKFPALMEYECSLVPLGSLLLDSNRASLIHFTTLQPLSLRSILIYINIYLSVSHLGSSQGLTIGVWLCLLFISYLRGTAPPELISILPDQQFCVWNLSEGTSCHR